METRKALRERVGREQQLVDRLRTATVHFADAQVERAWAISSSHQAGLSIRRIAGATDLSPSRVHQVLNSAESTDMPAWLSRLRETDRCLGGPDEAGPVGSNTEMCSRLASEAKVLQRCIDWLERMERGESVVVNLRLDTDENTDYVTFDHAREVSHAIRVARERVGQNLDGNFAIELGIGRAPDFAHAALAQLGGDAIVRDGLLRAFRWSPAQQKGDGLDGGFRDFRIDEKAAIVRDVVLRAVRALHDSCQTAIASVGLPQTV